MRTALALVVASLTLVACTSDTEDPPDGEDAAPVEVACPPELDEALRAWAGVGFSGSVVVTGPEGTTCEAAYGLADREEGRPITTDTVFSIGSVAKAFTAAAVLDLVAQDEVGLDDRAGDLVPGLTGAAADATVEQLLLHTSGLSGSHGQDHEPLGREEAVAAISALEQAAPGGEAFLYSNAGYTLLALLLEDVTGAPYRSALVERTLTVDGDTIGGFWDGDPAAPGPRAVGYDEDGEPSPVDGSFAGPHWALAGNGDLAMTTPELARWTRALFAGEVVAPDAVDLLETTTFDQGDEQGDGRGADQGDGQVEVPGWVRVDEETFGESAYAVAGGGGDVGHDVVTAWFPGSERVVTLASNGAEITAEDLLAEIGPALVAGDELPVPPDAAPVDPDALAAAEGTYLVDDGGRLEVAAAEDGLVVTAQGAAALAALFPPADAEEADARADHEAAVAALLRGETEDGRDELALLEEDIGAVTDVRVEGTVVAEREPRTYVTLTADEEVLAWYAVDDAGGIQAAELTDRWPSRTLIAAGADTFRSADAADRAAPVTLALADDRLTLTGPDGATVVATRG